MHSLFVDYLKVHSLKILTFSTNFLFGNAAILDYLVQNEKYYLLALFAYLKFFLLYQFCCVFQWIYMLVLSRTYREANYSERYTKLYKISRTTEGSYKSQEIRLMENGLVPGVAEGLKNMVKYFFR